jgi:hypothetical protein
MFAWPGLRPERGIAALATVVVVGERNLVNSCVRPHQCVDTLGGAGDEGDMKSASIQAGYGPIVAGCVAGLKDC